MGNKKRHKLADNNTRTLLISDCNEWAMVQVGEPGARLVLKVFKTGSCEDLFQELFLKPSRPFQVSVPKQLVGLDEKYMKQCLELIHTNTLQDSSLRTGFVSDHTFFRNTNFAVNYPMAVGLGPEDDAVMGSNNMMNVVGSPLFQKLGMSDQDARLGASGGTRKLFENYQSSPVRLASSPSRTPMKQTVSRNQKYQYDSAKKTRVTSDSGLGIGFPTDHRFSETSSSQGMLRCTSVNGFPQFTFSLNDEKELYVANATRAEAIHEKALDYVYSFHIKVSDGKLSDIPGVESDLMGKMKVSTSFSLCSGNYRVVEKEFVLVGTDDIHAWNHTSSQNSKRGRKLSKVIDMFKAGPSQKQRSLSISGGSNAILEDFSAGSDFLPNLELAAMVVKDRVQTEDHQEEIGGWGLKFLKKSRVNPVVNSSDGNCSTSMDIILPVGPHGGPRRRNAGPSSLIERWRSNGRCDCGGWDLGCPLKVLKVRPRSEGRQLNLEAQLDCKSFDIITEGSKNAPGPVMKMANIRDGLYFITFQTSLLSALQCFAIAVATIHSKNPSLSQKHLQT